MQLDRLVINRLILVEKVFDCSLERFRELHHCESLQEKKRALNVAF